jgi:hypothetical protein
MAEPTPIRQNHDVPVISARVSRVLEGQPTPEVESGGEVKREQYTKRLAR